MKIREFISTDNNGALENQILVASDDYNTFVVFLKGREDNRFARIGKFKAYQIDGAINSEKKFSKFLEKEYKLNNVYSISEFYAIQTITTTVEIEDCQDYVNSMPYVEDGEIVLLRCNLGSTLVKKAANRDV